MKKTEKINLICIERYMFTPDETIGRMSINGVERFHTLEPAIQSKMCLPVGKYLGVVVHSFKFNTDVIRFTGVKGCYEIHVGNYPRDTKGCILVGIKAPSSQMLIYSVDCFKSLMSMVGDQITINLEIKEVANEA